MIKIKIFVFNPFQENTCILSDESGECVIIDAGCSNPDENRKLNDFLRVNMIKPVRLICTHCHIDHILGNRFIYNEYGLLPECHKAEKSVLDSADTISGVFGMYPPKSPMPQTWLNENDIIRFGNSELKILYTPGHSPGHITLYAEQEKFILCGDVLFKDSIGRTDLPGGNYQELMDSISSKLLTLPEDVVVYPGHYESSTIGEEKLSNPYLKD